MSSINVLRENKAKYERRRNNSRNRRNNPSATNNNRKKYSKHFNHYNKLVKGYTTLIKKREDAELANLERDANNAVETINEPNNISPELRAQLNNLAVHRRYVDNVSNILAGKGTRRRRPRRRRATRRFVTNNEENQQNCDRKKGCCGKVCEGLKGFFTSTGGKRRKTRRKRKRKQKHNKKNKRKTRNRHKR